MPASDFRSIEPVRLRWAPVLFVGLLGLFTTGCATTPSNTSRAPAASAAAPPRGPLRDGTKEEWNTMARVLLPLLIASGTWTGPADGCAVALGVQPSDRINIGIGSHSRCKFTLVITDAAFTLLPPDELQAALAHEIGHLRLGHVAAREERRAAEKKTREDLHDKDITAGTEATARELEYRAYDRADEDAADLYGLALLERVIGRARACQAEVGLLERLVQVKSSSEVWLRTHPSPTERVKAVREACST